MKFLAKYGKYVQFQNYAYFLPKENPPVFFNKIHPQALHNIVSYVRYTNLIAKSDSSTMLHHLVANC